MPVRLAALPSPLVGAAPWTALLFAVAACASPATRAPSAAVPATADASATDSLRAPWRITRDGATHSYRVLLRAELQSRVDSLARVDTLESRTVLAWSATGDGREAQVFGRVLDFGLRTGRDTTWQAPPGIGFPVVFSASSASLEQQPALRDPAADGCDARSAVVAAWRETWVAVPARLVPQQTWQDSTELPLCRDGILLQTRVIRTFVADSLGLRDGRRVLHVRRSVASTVRGDGVQFGDSVRITGSGTGTARLVIAVSGGHVLDGEGRSELRLQLQGRRRTQQLVQLGALSITAP